MSRIRKVSFLVTGTLMFLCFLMSSTDLFIKEEVAEIKKISVYAASDENSYVEDLKRGILEIANADRVDVNYELLSGSETEDVFAQIGREYESGSQAVILFTERPKDISRYLRESGEKLNVITVNAFGHGKEGMPDISFDIAEAAGQLADAVQNAYGKNRKIIFLTEKDGISEEVGQKLKEVFLEQNMDAVCMEADEKSLEGRVKGQEKPVFIGCWITETEWALEHLKGEVLYGVGYSAAILKGVREGEIEGVTAFSMYGIGIHAIRQAIAVIEKKNAKDVRVSCRMITKENMKEQKEFLIPIH